MHVLGFGVTAVTRVEGGLVIERTMLGLCAGPEACRQVVRVCGIVLRIYAVIPQTWLDQQGGMTASM